MALLILALVAWLLALWAREAGLSRRKKTMRREMAALRREVKEREETLEMRRAYAGAMALLLRMKYQGLAAARALSVLNNRRPDAIKFQKFSIEFGDDVLVTRLKAGLPTTFGVKLATRVMYSYIAALRSTGAFRKVEFQTPGPDLERLRKDSGEATRQGGPTRAGEAKGNKRTKVKPDEQVWLMFNLRIESDPPWKGRARS